MTLAASRDLLRQAQGEGYAVGAFNVIGLEHAQAIVQAAELEASPVILQVSQNAVRYHLGSIRPIGSACRELAKTARVPVALHLDHATTWGLCAGALALDFGSVMFDASSRDFEANVELTAGIARRVHARHGALEAELGVVGGKDRAVSSEEGKTDPDLARWYVQRTGADALAVAVGTTHYMVEKTATVDLELIARLREVVDVPLVLHGSSGVPDADLREAIDRGITKVNTATDLNKAFTHAVRDVLAIDVEVVDPRTYLVKARQAMVEVIRARIRALGSAGRA